LREHALTFFRLQFQPGKVGNPGNILRGQGHGVQTVVSGRVFRHLQGSVSPALPGDRVLSCVWCRSPCCPRARPDNTPDLIAAPTHQSQPQAWGQRVKGPPNVLLLPPLFFQ
jgi:hypothetical protein